MFDRSNIGSTEDGMRLVMQVMLMIIANAFFLVLMLIALHSWLFWHCRLKFVLLVALLVLAQTHMVAPFWLLHSTHMYWQPRWPWLLLSQSSSLPLSYHQHCHSGACCIASLQSSRALSMHLSLLTCISGRSPWRPRLQKISWLLQLPCPLHPNCFISLSLHAIDGKTILLVLTMLTSLFTMCPGALSWDQRPKNKIDCCVQSLHCSFFLCMFLWKFSASLSHHLCLVQLIGLSCLPLSHQAQALFLETSTQKIKLIVALQSLHIAFLLMHVPPFDDNDRLTVIIMQSYNWHCNCLIAINHCLFRLCGSPCHALLHCAIRGAMTMILLRCLLRWDGVGCHWGIPKTCTLVLSFFKKKSQNKERGRGWDIWPYFCRHFAWKHSCHLDLKQVLSWEIFSLPKR